MAIGFWPFFGVGRRRVKCTKNLGLDQQCRERVHGGVDKSGNKTISVCVLVGLGGDWEQCECRQRRECKEVCRVVGTGIRFWCFCGVRCGCSHRGVFCTKVSVVCFQFLLFDMFINFNIFMLVSLETRIDQGSLRFYSHRGFFLECVGVYNFFLFGVFHFLCWFGLRENLRCIIACGRYSFVR